MGRVYLAARADEQYQKRVAIKLIKADVDRDEVVARFRLGEVSAHEGKFAEAEKAFRESLGIGRKIFPPDHIYIFLSLVGLGDALAAQGEALQAETTLREGLEIGRKILPKEASDLAVAESALGGCLTRLRRFGEAESFLLGSYQFLMAKRNASAATRKARQHVIDLYNAWGKPDKAREYAAIPTTVGKL